MKTPQKILINLIVLGLTFLLLNCSKNEDEDERESYCWECNAYFNGQVANMDNDCEETEKGMNQKMEEFRNDNPIEYSIVCRDLEE